jgi:LmbE family N-acetylglucosaminyl deacetylase
MRNADPVTIRPTDLGTILSIWAHPDDETYLAGATMAAAAAAGQRVVCVSLTAGELGTPDPAAWPPERLGPLRRREAAAAMAALGVTEHRVLELPDGGLADMDPSDGAAVVRAIIDEVQPDAILTFGPDGMTHHGDHVATSRWVTDAWDAAGRPGRLLHATATDEHQAAFSQRYEEWGVYMTDERPVGTPVSQLALQVVASGAALDQKLAALAAMASQTADAIAGDPELYAAMIAEEAFVDATP